MNEQSASYYKDLPLECYWASHTSFISRLSLLLGRRVRVKGGRGAPERVLLSRLPAAAVLHQSSSNDLPRAGESQGEEEAALSNQLPCQSSPHLTSLPCTQQAGD